MSNDAISPEAHKAISYQANRIMSCAIMPRDQFREEIIGMLQLIYLKGKENKNV